jgi:hypothetical protein
VTSLFRLAARHNHTRVLTALLIVAPSFLVFARAQPSFDRNDFLAAMERLHAFYKAPEGLQRPNGLSLDGRPDFLGIAAWIFDVYLTCRSSGMSRDDAWTEVVASISQTDEWKGKHPGQSSTPAKGCKTALTLTRTEMLQAMQRLDAFYQSVEGLQRPVGLSVDGAPDFLGIAAWVFDVYLNTRRAGQSPEAAWTQVVRAIQATDEWQQKHPDGARPLRFAIIGDFGIAGDTARDVAMLVRSWGVDFVLTTGDNNYMQGGASTIDANIGQYYSDFIFPYSGSFGSIATRNRFFPTLGNHDWETPGAAPYLAYFTLPGNERYYDFVQAPVHFFALDSDPNEPDGITVGSAQALWLQNRLASTTQPYRFVYLHHAPWSSGQNGSHPALQWPYAAWGASAVIAGHDHTYERIMRDGLPYFVNGAGGYALYSFLTPIAGSAVRFNGDFGAMLVEVDSKGAVFRFITRTGTTVDAYTVLPK